MPANDLSHRFAMFIGRSTVSRCSMMHAINRDWVKSHFLFSTMEYDSHPLWRPVPGWRVVEDFGDWMDSEELPSLKNWWINSRPKSLDQMTVRDQYYAKDKNTNRSILNWYHEFNIEMICETYTQGETFFPTEKTVRPLMAAKPFLVYGPIKFLRRLREMDFQTYQDLWDESYDQYQGFERWCRMQSVVRSICALSSDKFRDLMQNASAIAAYNRGRLADIIVTDKSKAMLEAGIVC